jgi:hypothetical protein
MSQFNTAPSPAQIDAEIADLMADCYADPLRHVMASYPWDEVGGPLEGRGGPDKWQREFLIELGEEVRKRGFDGVTAVEPIQFSTASGHGIGKSCLSAWIIIWIRDTRPGSMGTITATTAEQLRSRTFGELAKWHDMSLTRHWFQLNAGSAGSLNMYHHRHRTWGCSGQTCQEHNSEAFAGQHRADSTSYYLFDEASGVPDKIYEVRSGGLTDGEPMTFDFGNPTRNSGLFHANTFGRFRHRYITRSIDSRQVAITNKEYLQRMIDDHGIDSDLVKVRILGQAPSASTYQFIGSDDVDAAMRREMTPSEYNFAPVVIGVDPAWTGEDEFVITMRQGLNSKLLGTYAHNDNDVQMANLIAQFEDDHKADAVFVDGGFGTGVVSVGHTMGRDHWQIVWFSERSLDPGCLNKRAEMWESIRKWLKEGGCLEDDDVMRSDLTGVELVPRLDGKKQLESKEQMRSRGLASPNRADALAITFAFPVAAKRIPYNARAVDAAEYDYDPLG